MSRLSNFKSLETHAWLSRVYSRLTAAELKMALEFIEKRDNLSGDDFEAAINRMFIDIKKPKHANEILELLACANSMP